MTSTTKQRADLTFKHNAGMGRHGWLRLTPAYSVKLVEDILKDKKGTLNVFDPFSGTGTTALCAAMHGHNGIATDINPFLIWLGNAKVDSYSTTTLSKVLKTSNSILKHLSDDGLQGIAPPIFNIERWWDAHKLEFLCRLIGGINESAPDDGQVRTLLQIAFCRTMIALSNAAFNHQSMSFKADSKDVKQTRLFDVDSDSLLMQQYLADIDFVLEGAKASVPNTSEIILADARDVPRVFRDGIDLLITSPPYPNRMSYIRELRPYMYWLGFLNESREAGELDWKAIGGTWGIATSRVASWKKCANSYFPEYLSPLLEKISNNAENKSGAVLACYVGKYFEDMWYHIQSVSTQMNRGGEQHYVVGNSKFYDVLVPVERIYADMLKEAGAKKTEIRIIRKRNSKKELVEADVIANF